MGDGGGVLAPAAPGTNRHLYTDLDPIAGATFTVKIDTLREIDAFVRALDPRVAQVSASIAALHQEIEILHPDGQRLRDARPMARIGISVIVEENGHMVGGDRYGLDGLIVRDHWEGIAREALRIALVNLRAEARPRARMC